MKSNSFLKIILPILIIALAIGSFNYLKSTKSERKKPQTQEKIWLVDTINASLDNVAPDLTLFATIESPSLHTASAPAAGIVESVFVKPGSKVKQGDILLRLEQQDFVISVKQAKADVLDINAQLLELTLKQDTNQKALALEENLLALSQSELSRVKRLQQRGLGSDSALTDVKSALAKQQLSVLNKATEVSQYTPKKQQLDAKLMRSNAKLAQANLALERSIVSANFDGTVMSVDTAQGNRVKSAEKLMTLYPTQQLEAKTRIPARFQQEIQLMLRNKIPIKAHASIGKHVITMQLDRVAGQASANGIEVYFSVSDGQQFLMVGNFLKLDVKRAEQKNVVKLPLQALYGTARIYLLKNERLQGLDIETVGHFKDPFGVQHVLIRHPDLSNDDHIVITHLPNAITGLKVKTSEK